MTAAAWMALAVPAALAWLGVAAVWLRRLRRFCWRRRAVPWESQDVLLLMIALFVLLPGAIAQLWPHIFTGMDAAASRLYETLLRELLSLSFIRLLLVDLRRARPYQMGLHAHRLGDNILLGLGALVVSAPLVAGTYFVVTRFVEPQAHAVQQLLLKAPSLENILVAILGTTVVAPVVEELVFRGILLPWLRERVGVWPAVVMTSLIFAGMHRDAWPAPIPLFVLAMFLGALAARTCSLVGPIVLHATFNAANMLLLLVAIDQR